MKRDTTIRAFARGQTAKLFTRLGREIRRAAVAPDAEAVHDLRVTTRRLAQCLRVGRQFFPRRAYKRVKKQLKEQMDLAAEVRNRDIAVELLSGAHLPRQGALLAGIAAERREAEQKLRRLLAARHRKRAVASWRRMLEL